MSWCKIWMSVLDIVLGLSTSFSFVDGWWRQTSLIWVVSPLKLKVLMQVIVWFVDVKLHEGLDMKIFCVPFLSSSSLLLSLRAFDDLWLVTDDGRVMNIIQ